MSIDKRRRRKFLKELKNLCCAHGVHFEGQLRIVEAESGRLDIADEVYYDRLCDKRGPFLVAEVNYDEPEMEVVRGYAPGVIADTMSATMNPVDGKTYDSKSAYYRTVKAAGCEIVGSESLSKHQSVDRRPPMPRASADIKTAIEQLRSR